MLERLSDMAKAVRGRGEMAESLAGRWRRLEESGRLQPAVDELGPHAPRRGRAGETASYFENSRSRMDYSRYRAVGLPAGSGVIEGACRNVDWKRLKKSGMFRSVAGANKILALRRAVVSNAFDDLREYRAEEKKAA